MLTMYFFLITRAEGSSGDFRIGSSLPLSVEWRLASTLSNDISEATGLIETKFHLKHPTDEALKVYVFLWKSVINFGCYGDLKLPLTYNGKIKKGIYC